MADSTSSVHISGIVLSSLMFQHLNSDSDVEGLIIGELKAEERSNITDSQVEQIQFEETIYIQNYVVCRKMNRFFNGVGELNEDIVKEIESDTKQGKIIGWYRQRRNTDQQLTFREQLVHENLKKVLSKPEMIFLLLTPSEVTESGSTHRLEYAVFRSYSRQFHSVPLVVNNLDSLEQQDYCKFSTPCSSVAYNLAMQKHRSRFFSSEGSLKEVDEVRSMNDTLLSELQRACRNVESSERIVEKLHAEVSALRKRVSGRKQDRQEKEQKTATDVPAEENVLLCEAIRAALPGLPLYQQTALTIDGFPVPDLCCNLDHGIDIATTLPLILNPKLPNPKRSFLGKRRLAEQPPVKDKRRRVVVKETDESSLSATGSESEADFQTNHNGKLDTSNSPVF